MKNPRFWLVPGILLLITSTAAPTLFAQTFILPASWKYARGTQNAALPGFTGKMHQARKNSGLSATIARGNAQLNGALIEPQTGQPYVNLAITTGHAAIGNGWEGTTPVDAGGAFRLPGVVNFFTDANGGLMDNGGFNTGTGYPDAFFPGLPGEDAEGGGAFTNGQNLAVEFNTWLDLPAGNIILGVHHDDSVQLAFHPNDVRDIFRTQALGFDSNSGETDRTVTITVEEAGLYAVRVMMAQWTGDGLLEFYHAPVEDPLARVLVNDTPLVGLKVPAWQELTTPGRPYITSVNPSEGASGVELNTSISVQMRNIGASNPVLSVNNTVVTYVKQTNPGGETSLTYTPQVPFKGGQPVMVSLAYGAATSSWSFNTRTGKKALMITGGGALNSGDAYVSQRLSNTFGFDVKVKSDSGITLADADGVALIYNSSTVNSGLVAPANFENLAIPLINSESANTDDFKLLDLPYGGFGNGPSTMTMTIVNADHPITQGFATGPIQMFTANVQQHYGRAPSGGLSLMANAAQDHLYVIEQGSAVIDAEGEFIHPARRVHFGTGNDGAGLLTDEGKVLFDRVITWALGTPVPDAKPDNLTISRNPRDGVVTLVWTSLPGRKYRIESSLILGESTWPALDPAFVATASESMFIDNAAGTDPKRFYRIRLRP